MKHAFRWFGPSDIVTLDAIRQAGASIVVTALHQIPAGEVWLPEAIGLRRKEVEDGLGNSPLRWEVVESLPVAESIKTASPDRDRCIENHVTSLRNLAAQGIRTICYNFMPVLDWTRTDLTHRLPDGSLTLVYDHRELVAFDLFVLKRDGAGRSYADDDVEAAREVYSRLTDADIRRISSSVLKALPGDVDGLSLDELRRELRRYEDIGELDLRANLEYFLKAVVPTAVETGVRLAIHPDDPPFPILGLPRVVSTESDLKWLLDIEDVENNGLTFCTGSLGARPDNDISGMASRFAHRIHFAHLRSTRRDGRYRFHEADHLDGDVDMYAVVRTLLQEEERRIRQGRADSLIPMRPDHGHQMLDDIGKPVTHPGYSAIGRLRGLAELRGLELGVRRSLSGLPST